MMKRLSPWLAALLGGLVLPVCASGHVTVNSSDGGVTLLADIGNLAQLLERSKVNDPQTMKIIAEKCSTVIVEKNYRHVLQRLATWAVDEKGARSDTINMVLHQLMAVRVTGRQFVNLDLDWLNIHPEANYVLEGDYSLYLRKRDKTVTLMGAINGAGTLRWEPQRTVSTYLKGHNRLPGADLNQVMLIDPDGKVRVAPTAYWNEHYMEAEPGSVIWVGFSSDSLPDKDPELGRDIISVLRHRIPD